MIFTQVLEEKGYYPYVIDSKKGTFNKCKDPQFFSTYGPVQVEWSKKDIPEQTPCNNINRIEHFIYGLHEISHPPCLIWPRPYVLFASIDCETVTRVYSDSILDRVLEKYTCYEVFDAISNNNILIM